MIPKSLNPSMYCGLTPGVNTAAQVLMFPVKGEGVLVGLLADGEQCKLLKLHKAGDGAVDDG